MGDSSERGSIEAIGRRLVLEFLRTRMLRTWLRDQASGWRLVSGLWSPFYLQLRELCSYPELLRLAGQGIALVLRTSIRDADRLVGIAYGGIPLAVAASLASDIPCGMTRKLEGLTEGDIQRTLELYGQHGLVEGQFADGDHIILIDDLVTRFDTKLAAIRQIQEEMRVRGLQSTRCRNVVVLVDRQQGADATAAEEGVRLHALIAFRSQALLWLDGALERVEEDVISHYLDSPDHFQSESIQRELAQLAEDYQGRRG